VPNIPPISDKGRLDKIEGTIRISKLCIRKIETNPSQQSRIDLAKFDYIPA